MDEKRSEAIVETPQETSTTEKKKNGSSRRAFLGHLGGAAAATIAATTLTLPKVAEAAQSEDTPVRTPRHGDVLLNPAQRAQMSYQIRVNAAKRELKRALPKHLTNGDEARYSNRIGSYSKALPHTGPNGEVDPTAYSLYLTACTTGNPSDWDAIPLGGTTKIVDPQGSLAYDLEGADAAAIDLPQPPAALATNTLAAQAVEAYWMALCRDIPFATYGQDAVSSAAIAELSTLNNFTGPKVGGQVTAGTLFRGFTPGDLIGPYVSQFFVQPFGFGPLAINDKNGNPVQQYNCYVPGVNFLQDLTTFQGVQNGIPTGLSNTVSGPCYLHDGRNLCAFVHTDELYQAYFQGVLYCLGNKFAFNVGNPYNSSTNQTGFQTFGNPAIISLVAEVASRALKAAWYSKFFVHRSIRPEEYGGLVNATIMNGANYPLAAQVLNSQAVQQMFTLNNSQSYLLAHAFPEGCPAHPSYGSGHATVAGICSTIVKAFFEETTVIPNPVYSPDGQTLVPYTGADAGQITVMTEANKIAANVGIGRAHAGIHFREDYQASLALGEAYAISILQDQRDLYNLPFNGYTFTKFDGNVVTV